MRSTTTEVLKYECSRGDLSYCRLSDFCWKGHLVFWVWTCLEWFGSPGDSLTPDNFILTRWIVAFQLSSGCSATSTLTIVSNLLFTVQPAALKRCGILWPKGAPPLWSFKDFLLGYATPRLQPVCLVSVGFTIIKLITNKKMSIISQKGVFLFLVCCFTWLSSDNWLLKQKWHAITNQTTRGAHVGPLLWVI